METWTTPSVWCRLFHWDDWLDVSPAVGLANVPGTNTVIECPRCRRLYLLPVVRRRDFARDPAR